MDTLDEFFKSSDNRTLLEAASYSTDCNTNLFELKRDIL